MQPHRRYDTGGSGIDVLLSFGRRRAAFFMPLCPEERLIIMQETTNHPLTATPVGTLMRRYAVPCVISLLVAALYNIVDQIFIANTKELGSFGNAANTVVFPLTVVALAIAVMIGDGCPTL